MAITKKYFFLLFFGIILGMMSGCGDKTEATELIIESAEIGFAAFPEGTQTVTITSNTAWNVSIEQEGAWLSVSHATGNGSGELVFAAEDNTGSVARNATVTVSGEGTPSKIILVRQAAIWIELGSTIVAFAANPEETKSVTVTSNVAWNVSIEQEGAWLSVSHATGNGDGKLVFIAENNTSSQARCATVTVSDKGTLSKTILVGQAEKNGTIMTYSAKEGRYDINENEFVIMRLSPESGFIYLPKYGTIGNRFPVEQIIENYTQKWLNFGHYFFMLYFDEKNWTGVYETWPEEIQYDVSPGCMYTFKWRYGFAFLEEYQKGRYQIGTRLNLWDNPYKPSTGKIHVMLELEIE